MPLNVNAKPTRRRDGEHRAGPEENSVQEISVGSKTCRHRKSRLRFVVGLFRLPLIHTFDNHVIYLHLCRHFRHLGNFFIFDTEDFTNTCFVSGVVAVDVTLGMALAPAYRSETGDSDTDGRNFQPVVRKEEYTYAGQHNHHKHVRVDDVRVPLPIFLPNARVVFTGQFGQLFYFKGIQIGFAPRNAFAKLVLEANKVGRADGLTFVPFVWFVGHSGTPVAGIVPQSVQPP